MPHGPGVLDSDFDRFSILSGKNGDNAWTFAGAHGVHRVVNQIENHLLKLEWVGQYRRQIRRNDPLEMYMVAADFQAQKVVDIVEQILDPDREVLRFALTGKTADVLDDGVGSRALSGDFFQRFSDLGKVGWIVSQSGQAGLGIQGDCGDRLVDLVCQSGGHFAQDV